GRRPGPSARAASPGPRRRPARGRRGSAGGVADPPDPRLRGPPTPPAGAAPRRRAGPSPSPVLRVMPDLPYVPGGRDARPIFWRTGARGKGSGPTRGLETGARTAGRERRMPDVPQSPLQVNRPAALETRAAGDKLSLGNRSPRPPLGAADVR